MSTQRSPRPRRGYGEPLERALNPGAVIDGFRLEIAVAGRDPNWRERTRLESPLPPQAVDALRPPGNTTNLNREERDR